MATNKTNVAQLNDDWQYLNESEPKAHPTTDEQFNIHYTQSGMQSISNIKIEKRKDPPKAANDTTFNVSVTSITRDEPVDIKKVKVKGSTLSKKDLKAKAKATRILIHTATWYGWVWLVQIIFALINIVTFGMMASEGTTVAKFATIVAWKIKLVKEVIQFATGFNIADVVEVLYYISYGVIITIGILSVLVIGSQYLTSGIKPLSGEKASLKWVSLLFVLIGYSMALVPGINLIPWIGVWMYVVWKYPK